MFFSLLWGGEWPFSSYIWAKAGYILALTRQLMAGPNVSIWWVVVWQSSEGVSLPHHRGLN